MKNYCTIAAERPQVVRSVLDQPVLLDARASERRRVVAALRQLQKKDFSKYFQIFHPAIALFPENK